MQLQPASWSQPLVLWEKWRRGVDARRRFGGPSRPRLRVHDGRHVHGTLGRMLHGHWALTVPPLRHIDLPAHPRPPPPPDASQPPTACVHALALPVRAVHRPPVHTCAQRVHGRVVFRETVPDTAVADMTLGGLWRRVGLLLLLRVACASTVHGALLPGGICCCRGWVVDARLTTQCGYWLHISTPAADVEPHTLRGGRRTTRQTYRVPLPPPRGPRGALGPVLRRL
jgi:hypothetical protein